MINFLSILSQIIMLGIIYAFVVMGSFKDVKRLEMKEANLKATFIERDINQRFQFLDRLISDWSSWDDSYNFVLGKNKDFIDKNISQEVLKELQIDFIVFYDIHGNIVFSFTSLPSIPHGIMKNKTGADTISGIIIENDISYIVSTAPVTKTKPKPSSFVGSVAFGQLLTLNQVKDLESVLGGKVFFDTRSEVKHGKFITTNKGAITASLVTPTIDGARALAIGVEWHMEMYQKIKESMAYVGFALLIIVLLHASLMMILGRQHR